MQAIIIDPRIAGCSGDMFLASVCDLVEDTSYLDELVANINTIFNIEIEINKESVLKKGVSATYLKIDIKKDIKSHHATDLLDKAMLLAEKLSIEEKNKELALKMLNSLLDAESAVHGQPIEKLHLHETASIDTLLDIYGTVFLLERNGLLSLPIYGLPVNVGSGFVTFSHGTVSVPPPAVLEILKTTNYPFFSTETKGELLTPTGAIILVNIVQKTINQLPALTLTKLGKGAGTKNLEHSPNILSLMLVDLPINEKKHYLSMLETHMDDVSGEILGGMVPALLVHGALDISYYPLMMKKNRPAWCLRLICEEEKASELSFFVMKQFGTLGVREQRFARYELERRVISKTFELKGKIISCKFKERIFEGKVIGAKPEFDDVERIAKELEEPMLNIEKTLSHLYYLEEMKNE